MPDNSRPDVRGLVLIILDTLRSDFETFSGELPNLARLKKLCSVFPTARCGSFPTGPMRTDLLTGRLSFLDRSWREPEPQVRTLTRVLRDAGVQTALVTDNYVIACPQIGGTLPPEFDAFDFIRGAGSDPWKTPVPIPAALDPARERLSRDVGFELQYLANIAAWDEAGGTPTRRVFKSAARDLAALQKHDRFLLWIDSFACHEPWDTSMRASASQELPTLPLFPAYIESDNFRPEDIARWRSQYGESIRGLDSELGQFTEPLERVMRGGDVALAVLSDHGFLFGEYGFVGKPPNTPLPPQLHELVCWLSPHFAPFLNAEEPHLQPHGLYAIIRQLFGLGAGAAAAETFHLFGRNSPRSNYIAAADGNELYIGAKSDDGAAIFSAIETYDPALPLIKHPKTALTPDVRARFRRALADGKSTWIEPFRRALEPGTRGSYGRWRIERGEDEALPAPQTVDVLVVCALDVEFEALRDTLSGAVPLETDDRMHFWHFFTRVSELDVAVVQLGAPWAGNVSSCGATASLLPLLDPWLVVSFGIAGTLDPEQVKGRDVVFARSVSYIDLRKETDAGASIMKQIPQMMTRPELLNVLEKFRTPGVHKADIVSSEAVVKSAHATRREVAAQAVADAKAVEMEAFGVYKACDLDEHYGSGTRRSCVAIKGISDGADAQKDDRLHEAAAHNAADFLRVVLMGKETATLRAAARIEERPLPFRPFSMEHGATDAAAEFLTTIRSARAEQANASSDILFHAVHLRRHRPRVFYHWRIDARGMHWIELYFLRVLRRLGDLGYPIECLITDRLRTPGTQTELSEWKDRTVQLVHGILGPAEHQVIFYRDVLTNDAELAAFASASGCGQTMLERLSDPPPLTDPAKATSRDRDPGLNMQLNLWLRYIASRSRVDGTCVVLHRPGSASIYELLWHFGDLLPGLVRTRDMDLGGVSGKFGGPGRLLYLMPPHYGEVIRWLKAPAITKAVLKEFLAYLSENREGFTSNDRKSKYVEALHPPNGWFDAKKGSLDALKGGIALELAHLTETYWRAVPDLNK